MAAFIPRLPVSALLVPNEPKALYTVDSGVSRVTLNVNITNRDSTTGQGVEFCIGLTRNTNPPNDEDWLNYYQVLGPRGCYERFPLTLFTGCVLWVLGTGDMMSAQAWGEETPNGSV